jgi:hypothetical protein
VYDSEEGTIPLELGKQLIKAALKDRRGADKLEADTLVKVRSLLERNVPPSEIRNIVEKDLRAFVEKSGRRK